MFLENVVLTGALSQTSYTNSVLDAFKLTKGGKFIIGNVRELVIIVLVNVLFYMCFAVLLVITSFLLLIPILGALVFAILAGFYTSWHTVYLPSLFGQLWQQTKI